MLGGLFFVDSRRTASPRGGHDSLDLARQGWVVGEVAGYGGGSMHGYNALEGIFPRRLYLFGRAEGRAV